MTTQTLQLAYDLLPEVAQLLCFQLLLPCSVFLAYRYRSLRESSSHIDTEIKIACCIGWLFSFVLWLSLSVTLLVQIAQVCLEAYIPH